MFSEKMTYDKFMSDAYPKLAKDFDKHRSGIHDDLLPLWETYKRKSLDYYQNAFQHSASSVTEAQVFGGVFEKKHLLDRFSYATLELGNYFKHLSEEYNSRFRELQSKLTNNYPLFYTDQELKAMLEGFIEARKRYITQTAVPDALSSRGVKNYIVHQWKLGEPMANFFTLDWPLGAQRLARDVFFAPINKALDDAIAYLKQKQSVGQQGISPSGQQPVTQDATIITLRTMRSDLLRTLQSI